MSDLPKLLRGAVAIAEHLEMTAKTVTHLHIHGMLPTFRAGGTPYATPAALDDWKALFVASRLPMR